MHSTEPMRPQWAPGASGTSGHAPGVVTLAASEPPTFGEMVEEVLPLIGVVLVVAPPAIFVAGPWLVLGLMLSAPFAVVVALLAAAVALVALVVLAVAILVAPPYLLVRHLRARRARAAVEVASARVPSRVVIGSARVAA
jgi:hypothetical protein